MIYNERAISLKKEAIITLVNFIALLGVAVIVPLFHNQMATGPIINAVFFVAVMMVGVEKALFISLIPSVIALSIGLLPIILAPMIPFIMIGNVILISGFNFLKDKNYWLAVILSSFLKFIFLYASSFIVVNLIMKKEIASSISSMMSWPQLITALLGGFLAYIFLKIIKKI